MTASPALLWALATGGPWPDPARLAGDAHFMALALGEGLQGVGHASPNPPVGCVLVQAGQVIGRGGHHRAGGPHAEVLAIQDARARGAATVGATAYVTLEPCCHVGRTPPCTEALSAAGVSRVAVGARDPNPKVDGGGIARLRARGIEVAEGVLGSACARFHAPFFKNIQTGLPWVTLLLPGSGCTPAQAPMLEQAGYALRRCADAVAVDEPWVARHDPRIEDGWPGPILPHRALRQVVLDPTGSLAPGHRVWAQPSHNPALRATLGLRPPLPGVEDLALAPGPPALWVRSLLAELARRGVGNLLFEGGGSLARELLALDLVDVCHRFAGTPSLQDPDPPSPALDQHRIPLAGGSWELRRRPV